MFSFIYGRAFFRQYRYAPYLCHQVAAGSPSFPLSLERYGVCMVRHKCCSSAVRSWQQDHLPPLSSSRVDLLLDQFSALFLLLLLLAIMLLSGFQPSRGLFACELILSLLSRPGLVWGEPSLIVYTHFLFAIFSSAMWLKVDLVYIFQHCQLSFYLFLFIDLFHSFPLVWISSLFWILEPLYVLCCNFPCK